MLRCRSITRDRQGGPKPGKFRGCPVDFSFATLKKSSVHLRERRGIGSPDEKVPDKARIAGIEVDIPVKGDQSWQCVVRLLRAYGFGPGPKNLTIGGPEPEPVFCTGLD